MRNLVFSDRDLVRQYFVFFKATASSQNSGKRGKKIESGNPLTVTAQDFTTQ